jgi:hypothetical protein
VGQVLRHQIHFHRPLSLQPLRFGHEPVRVERAVLSSPQRDGAERASVVAALADLEVPHVTSTGERNALPRMRRGRATQEPAALKLGDQPPQVAQAHEQVDFRERRLELFAILFDEASDGNDSLAGPVFLQTADLDQRLDGFLLRRVDEAARVDEDHVGPGKI